MALTLDEGLKLFMFDFACFYYDLLRSHADGINDAMLIIGRAQVVEDTAYSAAVTMLSKYMTEDEFVELMSKRSTVEYDAWLAALVTNQINANGVFYANGTHNELFEGNPNYITRIKLKAMQMRAAADERAVDPEDLTGGHNNN